MENLSISDAPPPGGPAASQAGLPQPIPQLPPQMFTTAAQLLDLTDKKLMVVLRDGRKLIGVLRSWDQFANIVLQSTTERIFAPKPDSDGYPFGYYADITHGMFLVRGENVLLLGEIDLDKDDDPPPGYEPAELDIVKKMVEEKKAADKAKEKHRLKKLAKMGFEGENLGELFL
ncbi:U6 snRNA-associated Sm-like protein LSm1 [Cladobotryum mycophilum]|uniref:U6 snRNA-associated Sm-like protein LSm1 n=1 Tax=Cladobotryum mycophilum TaxID=491253 RepID=A0ABR0SYQ9_9HYPO